MPAIRHHCQYLPAPELIQAYRALQDSYSQCRQFEFRLALLCYPPRFDLYRRDEKIGELGWRRSTSAILADKRRDFMDTLVGKY